MTTYYRIVDWDKHYEVDAHGHAWQPGKSFRQGALEYSRTKARRDWSHRLLVIKELGDEVDELLWAASLGIFGRLCSMVACEPRDLRAGGIIRYSDGQPATIEQMARMFRYKVTTMEKVLGPLLDPEVRWIEAVSEISGPSPETCQGSQEAGKGAANPGGPGDSLSLPENPFKSRTKQSNTRKEQTSQEEAPPETTKTDSASKPWVDACESPPSESELRPPALHDIYSLSGFDHVRLAFLRELRSTLGCDSNASNVAIINFERWVHEEFIGPHATHEERMAKLGIIMGIARDCRKAIKPAAAFMQRAKDELGYIPPTTGKLREKSA